MSIFPIEIYEGATLMIICSGGSAFSGYVFTRDGAPLTPGNRISLRTDSEGAAIMTIAFLSTDEDSGTYQCSSSGLSSNSYQVFVMRGPNPGAHDRCVRSMLWQSHHYKFPYNFNSEL